MKTLHICNLANVAYGFCKILKAGGQDVRLICHDVDHLMSQPEWDDQDLDYNNFPDENNFFLSNTPVELTRPDWYCRVDIKHYQDKKIKYLSKLAPRRVKEWLRPYYYKLFNRADFNTVGLTGTGEVHEIADKLSAADIAKFRPNIDWFKGMRHNEDVVFSYVLAPVYTMFAHDRPFIAVEIGTMRELPFENTANGRLLRAAYKAADHVLITNPDVKKQADILGLPSYSFCPHPVDENRYKPTPDMVFRKQFISDIPDTDWVGVAPARQNWSIKGNNFYLEALRDLRAQNYKVSLIIPAWGQDVDRSKAYARKLGVNKYIKWIPPVNESTLIKMYSNFDFVLDQFVLGVFGLITPKALACGAAVITSYDETLHDWCFQESPPLLSAFSSDDISKRIIEVTVNGVGTSLSSAARSWFLEHHSTTIVRRCLESAIESATRNFENKR